MLDDPKWTEQLAWMNKITDDGYITDQTRRLGNYVSLVLWGKLGCPAAATGSNQELFFSWDSIDAPRQHHLEVEIQPTGLFEVFYRNRVSGETYFDEFNSVKELMSGEAMTYVRRLEMKKDVSEL